jgi:hypothetical protein
MERLHLRPSTTGTLTAQELFLAGDGIESDRLRGLSAVRPLTTPKIPSVERRSAGVPEAKRVNGDWIKKLQKDDRFRFSFAPVRVESFSMSLRKGERR